MTPLVCHTRLTSVQRIREEDEEGIAAESATIKRKVSVPVVRLVSTEDACETCKKAGVAAKCAYGTSAACARCKSAKLRCSLAQGRHRQRKPTKAAGSLVVVAVVVETTQSKSAVLVFPSMTHQFDRWKDGSAVGQGRPQQKGSLVHQGRRRERGQGGDNPAQLKGKARAVPKKTGGKLEARKTRDTLACRLNHLHFRLFQIRAKVKELEVEHAVVMSEVSEIVEALKDMDL